jgi:pimeloyl-ACP methyl ester carboxylesterase
LPRVEKRTLDLGGPVHVADFGGAGPPLVLVHGLGGSYTNWMAVGGALARRGRAIAVDLLGFGRTPLAGREPSVAANVALVGRLLDHLGEDGATLVGNSLGGLVSLLVAADRPDIVSRLVLVGPALPRPPRAPIDRRVATLFALYAVPGVGELFMARRLAQVGPERVLTDTLRLCGVDPRALPAEIWDEAVTLARERAGWSWTRRAFLGSARSMLRTHARRAGVEAAIRRVRARTLITQGAIDRLVPVAVSEAAARLQPSFHLEVMEGVGHVPMLQVPDRWLAIVDRWLVGR